MQEFLEGRIFDRGWPAADQASSIASRLSRVPFVLLGLIVFLTLLFVALFKLWHPDDGFSGFVPAVAKAAESSDSAFFVERAGISLPCGAAILDACEGRAANDTVRVVSGYAAHPISAHAYTNELGQWFANARTDQMDEFGTRAPRLFATRCFQVSDEAPHNCVARATLLTSLQDTPRGLERSVRNIAWTKEDGHWRIWWDSVASGSPNSAELRQWLDGTCRVCLEWKVWE